MTSNVSLQAAYRAKGPGYQSRTRHLDTDGQPRFINRLIHENAPYLLQHAHNPVDWYPWGKEAFAQARAENKPVFLSIGYATCHWCHVMEYESFENLSLAERLNRDFVAIKVDREMHPDIDETYMRALLLISGHGGWPMSSFLTPEGKPFFAGTYYPPARFDALLAHIAELWRDRQADLLSQAEQLSQAIAEPRRQTGAKDLLAADVTARALDDCLDLYDPDNGGFSRAPKFPHEPLLLFLLDQQRRQARADVLQALVHSLEVMARGGVYDQIGGGFHRYSTDDHWIVPHFEKMLYNQAQLSRIYVQAWQLTGQASFRRTGEDILDYVLREMTDSQGRFHSATDADSEGAEGSFFVWTPAQIDAALGADDAAWIKPVLGITEAGNFAGRSIPFLPVSLETLAERDRQPLAAVLERFARCREQLRWMREQRPKPLCDDKIILAWNGLMITALAEASRLLKRADYGAAAQRAAEALWQGNSRADGGLLRIAKGDNASVPASLEDYAYFAEACLHLHDLSSHAVWLERAQGLCDQAVQRFGDGDGGFYLSEAGIHPTGMERARELGHDGATPSCSGVLLQVLAQLGQRSEQRHDRQQAGILLGRLAQQLMSAPSHYPSLLIGVELLNHGRCDSLDFAAAGKIRLLASRCDAQRITLQINIAAGLHLNAATGLKIEPAGSDWHLSDCRLPEPRPLDVAFQDAPLLTHAGQVQVNLILDAQSGTLLTRLAPIRVKLQACTDQICLPAETLRLAV
ncbi:Thioredoxin-related protein [Thiorhodovibrio winogradskyi]|uniref:Thioredoxin-related protein n=1 Tax=Thiorhodovibrio winogradskyi TaxID=77007 RepID=A0ABZ0S6M3_9GAMM|nr:thioredoxin domain-containing protein [Thiorhodovibrio winogradskyi]